MAEVCGALAGSVGGGAYLSDVPLFEEASVFAAVLGGLLAVGGGMVATDGDHVPLLGVGVGAAWLAATGGAFCTVVSSLRDERRSSNQPTMTMLMTSSATMATAHTGKRAFGGATLTSNRAGPVCRWRSVSDFLSASRMNDIVQPPCVSAR